MTASMPLPGGTDWSKELVELLQSPNQDDWTTARAMRLARIPRSLFRYRPPTDYALKNLRAGSEWLSPATAFNDLFDSTVKVDAVELMRKVLTEDIAAGTVTLPAVVLERLIGAADPIAAMDEAFAAEIERMHGADVARKAKDFFRNYLVKTSGEMTESFSTLARRGVRVLCLSEDSTSAVMWGHYARSNEGFCLEYDLSTLGPDDLRARNLYPVIYSEKRFQVRITRPIQPNPYFGVLASIHKETSWSYEREWRIVMPVGDTPPNLEWVMPKPTGVLLGASMTADYRRAIEEIAEARGIPRFEMIRATDGFGLIAKPV